MSNYTLDDLAAIKQAIATGELTIEKDGRRVTYRSMSELRAARAEIEAELQQLGQLGSRQVYATTYAQFDRD